MVISHAAGAGRLRSEHVARVTDVGTLANGAPYIVMEYLDGADLAAWLRDRGALPVEQAVEFVLQACIAVADAHALGIVHRDLKPANLFCVRRSDGQLSIKVLDFGISKMGRRGSASSTMTAQGHALTQASALMGSPLYMSPEQMRSSKDVDAQTDIWALGVILFELMAGRPVFEADTVTELAIKVASEPTPAIRTFRSEIPPALDAVIAKCLEKDRHQRYRNVAELALALLPFAPKRAKASVERISGIIQAAGLSASALAVPLSPRGAGTQVSAGTLPPLGRTTEGKRGHKVAVGAGLAGAMALVALVGSMIWVRRGAVHHEDQQTAGVQAAIPAVSPPPTMVNAAATQPEARSAQVVRLEDLPVTAPTRPTQVAIPQVATTPRNNLPVRGPAPVLPVTPVAPTATAKAAPSTPTPAPTASKCDPPYYFDAKGNRLFKKECL
jgi:eukaryotic-like serine/threonine-protein kinase